METNSLYFLTVNYNSSDLVARLIESLGFQAQADCQIIIVNNSPEDQEIFKLTNKLNNDSLTILESSENIGFGRACNLGLNWIYDQNAQAIVWLINPDAYFSSDSISPEIYHTGSSTTSYRNQGNSAIAFFQNHSQISILGTSVYNSQGKITSAGGRFTPGSAALSIVDSLPKDLNQEYTATDWVSGCSMLINLANFRKCPQFDDRYFLYYEDLDFCLRYGAQGHQIAVTHLLRVVHDTSSISDRHIMQKYKYITQSYLVHIEKHGNLATFMVTNIRMLVNTIRLIIIRPQQGLGKLLGFCSYWLSRL